MCGVSLPRFVDGIVRFVEVPDEVRRLWCLLNESFIFHYDLRDMTETGAAGPWLILHNWP